MIKRNQFHVFFGILMILFVVYQQSSAQDKKSSRVRITITENDRVTSDTTFELKEGQDPEMISEEGEEKGEYTVVVESDVDKGGEDVRVV
jgi:hypothetical protein